MHYSNKLSYFRLQYTSENETWQFKKYRMHIWQRNVKIHLANYVRETLAQEVLRQTFYTRRGATFPFK